MKILLLATLLLTHHGFSETLTGTSTSRISVPVYDLMIEISPDSKQMVVRGEVTIPPKDYPQDRIQFALSELIQDVAVEIVLPIGETNPEITKTHRPWARPGWGQYTWSITPKKVIAPDTRVVLRFQYRYVGEKPGFVLSASNHCFFASGINSAWYPQVEEFPRTDDGIRLRGIRSTGKLAFVLPSGWSVYSPGKRKQNSKVDAEFLIDQPVFLSFAAAKYSTVDISDPLGVSLYQLKPRGERMNSYLKQTARILEVLSTEFGNYPYPAFAIAEVPADEAQEAGFAGASLDGFMLATTDFLNQEFNTAYYGHEIGHQWWGNLVRPEGPEGRWILSEAIAQYGSLRAVELLEGAAKAELYRRKGYPGYIQDQSGFGYLMLSAAGVDLPVTKLPADGALSRWLADSKGFFVWDMLSRYMGRERFSSGLKSITAKYSGRRILWKDFKNELKQFSDKEIGWFFTQWFEQTGAPEWQLKWQQHKNGRLTLHLSQSRPYFRFTMQAHIRGNAQQTLVKELQMETESNSWSWDVPFQVASVEINPHFETLAWTKEYKDEAKALAPYTRGSLLLNDGNTIEAKSVFTEELQRLRATDMYGVAFLLHYGLSDALFQENAFDQSRKHLEIALNLPVTRPERLPWAYLQLAGIADKQNDRDLVCSSLKSVLIADQSAMQKTGATEHTEALSKKHSCQLQTGN